MTLVLHRESTDPVDVLRARVLAELARRGVAAADVRWHTYRTIPYRIGRTGPFASRNVVRATVTT